jgi:hypothetical protein
VATADSEMEPGLGSLNGGWLSGKTRKATCLIRMEPIESLSATAVRVLTWFPSRRRLGQTRGVLVVRSVWPLIRLVQKAPLPCRTSMQREYR